VKLRWRLTLLTLAPLGRLLLDLRVVGRERLVRGAQILATNHVTNADPVVIGLAAARELHFLAKEELFTASRVFAWLIRSFNAWPIRRGGADAGAIRTCSRLLQYRQTLVLFPEGTRSRTGEIARFKPGVGMLALTNRVPVVPTRILGLDKSWVSYRVDRDFVRRGFRKRPQKPARVTVVFGEPVLPGDYRLDRRGYVRMTQTIEERVRALGAT
jgi:1-acyl-sn-glycerol-3-phosphate acyltransferase